MLVALSNLSVVKFQDGLQRHKHERPLPNARVQQPGGGQGNQTSDLRAIRRR
jgi:hypothetical protein